MTSPDAGRRPRQTGTTTTVVACIETADKTRDSQLLRVAVYDKKESRTANSGWSSNLGVWVESYRFFSTSKRRVRRYLLNLSLRCLPDDRGS
jgi:hypothetical protein